MNFLPLFFIYFLDEVFLIYHITNSIPDLFFIVYAIHNSYSKKGDNGNYHYFSYFLHPYNIKGSRKNRYLKLKAKVDFIYKINVSIDSIFDKHQNNFYFEKVSYQKVIYLGFEKEYISIKLNGNMKYSLIPGMATINYKGNITRYDKKSVELEILNLKLHFKKMEFSPFSDVNINIEGNIILYGKKFNLKEEFNINSINFFLLKNPYCEFEGNFIINDHKGSFIKDSVLIDNNKIPCDMLR